MREPWPLQINDDLVDQARLFVFSKWQERAAEKGLAPPVDLSGSCKFSSMFAARVFGLEMAGNWDHQFCLTPEGEVLDLNEGAADIAQLEDAYRHDKEFWLNPDHAESMDSCYPRVKAWLREFSETLRAPGQEGPE